jgi:hypothetical protein
MDDDRDDAAPPAQNVPPRALSAAIDAWHDACHGNLTNIEAMRRVLAHVIPLLPEGGEQRERRRIEVILMEMVRTQQDRTITNEGDRARRDAAVAALERALAAIRR